MPASPPDRSLDLLAGRVFDIPEPQFVDLVRSLEARRLRVDQRATADAVLSRLRPRMSVARPARRPTPQRLFCLPFEDLLYDPGSRRKAVGRIPRSAIAPIWAMFGERAGKGTIEAAAAALRAADPEDSAAVLKAGGPLWSESARVLSTVDATARKTPNGRAQLRDALGGEPVLASLDDIIVMLRIAHPILELRSALPPPPIETVDKHGLAALVETLKTVAALHRDAVPYVLFVLMARLRDLGMLAELFDKLADTEAGDLIRAVSDQAGEAVVSQSEDRLIDVRTELADEDLPKADVARALGREVDALERAARAVGGGRALARRIDRVKAELGRVAREHVVAGADEHALAAIAALDDPLASNEEELQTLREAEDRIVALRLCRKLSDDPETRKEIEGAVKRIAAGLDARGKQLVQRLEANDVEVSVIDLYNTVRLVELVEGSDKADKLRLAGMKAMKG